MTLPTRYETIDDKIIFNQKFKNHLIFRNEIYS